MQSATRFAVVVALFAVVVVGCSTGGDDTTTTAPTTTLPSTTPVAVTDEQQAFLDALPESGDLEADPSIALAMAESTCVLLEVLQASGTPPGNAAEAIDAVVLGDATPLEMSQYGMILSLAPTTLCTSVERYGEAVSYWLGF